MPKVVDRTGEKFGRLLVLGLSGLRGKDRMCRVRCDCGTVKDVVQSKLTTKSKPVRSCGCLAKENHHRTHGMTGHSLYPIWRAMITRCYNHKSKAYANYGGRGVAVCDEWRNNPKLFINWLESKGYKKGLEVDRIDNDKNYSPENCRVTTVSRNCRNRRNNVYVDFLGENVLLIELSEKYAVKYATLYNRIFNMNLSAECAVNFNQNNLGKEGLR